MHTLSDGDRIAVVDDMPQDAETTSIVLVDAGLSPETVVLLEDANAMVDTLVGNFAGVVCDHRLQGKVPYFGAEVVAACIARGLPAVLITTYADPRDNATIQSFRPLIPEMLTRGSDSSPIALRDALNYAAEETAGNYRVTRRPHRTIVRIAAKHDDEPPTIELLIPAWSTSQVASFPQASLSGMDASARPGQRFLADVNIYAESHMDLYATNFEPTTDLTFDELIERTSG